MYEKFIDIINENNGILTTKQAVSKGISRVHLKKMTDMGLIRRLERGIYITDIFLYDEYYIFQLKHPNSIFSYNTALYLQNMSERVPNKMDVTTKRSTNLFTYKDKINLHRVNENIFELGKIEVKTIYGNTVYAYNLERTVCDIIIKRSAIDFEVASKAIKKCVRSEHFQVNKMFEYAYKLNAYDKVKNYMEAII